MMQGVRDLSLIDKMPLMLQYGLADCIRQTDKANVILRIEKRRKPGTYIDMNEIAAQSIECAIKNGYKTLYVLAFPVLGWHYGWFLLWKDARRHGIKVHILWRVWRIPSDPQSIQYWTTKWYIPLVYGAKRFLTGVKGQ